ncbi:predicted protein [Pyrenophora tritici-repentis Pt-1C-BFP]|uniref:Uncharacterized protein n=1 Tax=Pyrenophora tritici-repentis (strain Pt-1C-BFP) TaxID=426418 RepID=B2WE28_PYRTR|nr:uncharacterized protein PTRG_08401 [Pyrenophora tritici-repentis Pt-1C-BFP]EDU51320.1 predicted protein [Pyrenophora tritici-repentis Pt-1C-BFP]
MSSSSNITSRYPVAYFLCDVTLTGKILKALLGLDKVPRLRTAQITGFRRGMGDSGANVVVYDGSNFAVENSTHLRSLSASFVHKNEVSLGFFKVSGASDTAVVESSAEDEVETQAPDNMSGDTEDVYKAFCAQQINSHTNVLANTGAVEEADDAKDIDLGTDIAPAESILSAGMSNEANISKNDQEDISTPKEKSWAPTIPWRKELATSPVRPTMTLPQAPSASTVKFRKAGGAIRNLVDMFEGLSSKSTPEKSS